MTKLFKIQERRYEFILGDEFIDMTKFALTDMLSIKELHKEIKELINKIENKQREIFLEYNEFVILIHSINSLRISRIEDFKEYKKMIKNIEFLKYYTKLKTSSEVLCASLETFYFDLTNNSIYDN